MMPYVLSAMHDEISCIINIVNKSHISSIYFYKPTDSIYYSSGVNFVTAI